MQNDMSWLFNQIEVKVNIQDVMEQVGRAQQHMVNIGKTPQDAKNISFTVSPKKEEQVQAVPQRFGGVVVKKGISYQKIDKYSVSIDIKNPNTGAFEKVYLGNGTVLQPMGQPAPQPVKQPYQPAQPVHPPVPQVVQPVVPVQPVYPTAIVPQQPVPQVVPVVPMQPVVQPIVQPVDELTEEEDISKTLEDAGWF